MNRRRNPRPAVQPITPNNLTLKLEPDAKLSVTVVTPDKPAQPLKLGLLVTLILFVVGFFLWLWLSFTYTVPISETPQPIRFDGTGMEVAVTSPAYATYKDEMEILLHIVNRGAAEFTGSVTLTFTGAPAFPLPTESATAKLEKLLPGAGQSHRMKFALRQTPRWFSGQIIQTAVTLTRSDRAFAPIAGPTIAVAPHTLPLRTANTVFGNSAVVGAIAALLWEVIRKRLYGWEAK